MLIAERKGDVAGGPQLAGPWRPQKELGFYAECHGKSLECCRGECCGLIYSLQRSLLLCGV